MSDLIDASELTRGDVFEIVEPAPGDHYMGQDCHWTVTDDNDGAGCHVSSGNDFDWIFNATRVRLIKDEDTDTPAPEAERQPEPFGDREPRQTPEPFIPAVNVVDGDGRKDDTGKPPWDLLPFDAIGEVVKVLGVGAVKHSPRGWESGAPWSKHCASAMRHLAAWQQGEDNDPESGISHLAHALSRVMFLLAYSLRGLGEDDRPEVPRDDKEISY